MENKKKSSYVTSFRSNLILRSSFIAVALVCLFGLATLYKDLLPIKAFQPMKQDFPIAIQGIKIRKADTGWIEHTKTERPSDKQDPFLPKITLYLTDDSTDASFICYFADYDEQPMGDSFKIKVVQGKFALTNDKSISIRSLKGFEEAANYYAYRYEKKNFWSFIINQIDESGENKIIARIPIPPHLVNN